MSRMNMYHSYEAVVRKSKAYGHIVRILDRYYPGPPGPEYSTVLNLEPHEAHYLGHELIKAAAAAKKTADKETLDASIAENTKLVAENAKAEADAS